MDERKRAIRELTDRRGEYLRALDDLLEEVGRRALSSSEDYSGVAGDDAAEYRRLNMDHEEALKNAAAVRAEIDLLREFREKERRLRSRITHIRKDLFSLDANLGEAVLAETAVPEAAEPFRRRLEGLVRRAEEAEARILDLENSGAGDFFAVVGRSLKGALLRSSMASRLAEIRRLYGEAGKALAASEYVRDSEVPHITAAAQAQALGHGELSSLEGELAAAVAGKAEAMARLDRLDAGRFPSRAADAWAARAETYGERLRACCRDCGEKLTTSQSGDGIAGEALERIRTLRESVAAADRQIAKNRAAVQMDILSEELRRLRNAAGAQERRIEDGRVALETLRARIAETEEKISELSKI